MSSEIEKPKTDFLIDPLPMLERIAAYLTIHRDELCVGGLAWLWQNEEIALLDDLVNLIAEIKRERGDTDAARHIEELKKKKT